MIVKSIYVINLLKDDFFCCDNLLHILYSGDKIGHVIVFLVLEIFAAYAAAAFLAQFPDCAFELEVNEGSLITVAPGPVFFLFCANYVSNELIFLWVADFHSPFLVLVLGRPLDSFCLCEDPVLYPHDFEAKLLYPLFHEI